MADNWPTSIIQTELSEFSLRSFFCLCLPHDLKFASTKFWKSGKSFNLEQTKEMHLIDTKIKHFKQLNYSFKYRRYVYNLFHITLSAFVSYQFRFLSVYGNYLIVQRWISIALISEDIHCIAYGILKPKITLSLLRWWHSLIIFIYALRYKNQWRKRLSPQNKKLKLFLSLVRYIGSSIIMKSEHETLSA